MSYYSIGIDPGLGGTGIAIGRKLEDGNLEIYDAAVLHSEGTSKDTHYIKRCNQIADRAAIWISARDKYFGKGAGCALRVMIEEPKIWITSGKSLASANRGDVLKLACVFASLCRIALIFTQDLYVIGALTWKGQMPKQAVIARMKKLHKEGRFTVDKGLTNSSKASAEFILGQDHIADAIGMILDYHQIL